MKTTLTLLTIILITVFVSACGKEEVTPLTKEEQVARMLTGTGNKIWYLKGLKENNVVVSLTTDQARYKKTYTMVAPQTVLGTFTDSDNYVGDWSMRGSVALHEEFSQIGGTGFGFRDYTIITVTDTELRMSYGSPLTGKKIEELYHAY